MPSVTLGADLRDAAPAAVRKLARVENDAAMIRAVAQLTRDLNAPSPAIYWADLIGSAAVGYAGLFLAIGAGSTLVALGGAVIAVLGLYRAASFIHELTHIRPAALPGFRAFWNAILGVPLFVPSFMYEGVHNLHHQRLRYGTAEDPEYLPLARMKPWTLPVFVLVSALGPIGLMLRYALLAPLSALVPALRNAVIERYSSLSINPDFRRRAPEGAARRDWLVLEAATSLWAIALLAAVVAGIVPLHGFLIFLGVASAVMVLNQIRTLVAHLWENDGEVMTVTGQFLDSVNVPPPGLVAELWAPVGLRYHALHHLLPGVPYHRLAEAHRRRTATLDPDSAYHRANYKGLPGLVVRLGRNTLGRPGA